MKMHYKKISKKDIEIISLIQELNLMKITLINRVQGNILIEYEGKHIGRTQWDILKMYEEIIYPFHSVKTSQYSAGIYSFWDGVSLNYEKSYLDYLKNEIEVLRKFPVTDSYTRFRSEICGIAINALEKFIKKGVDVKEFSLLHGDLYNGNILINAGRYVLIDFEYLRFGPPLLEWAFLLCWDLIVNDNKEIRKRIVLKVLSEKKKLIENNILTQLEMEMIFEMYMPVILSYAVHSAINNQYKESTKILELIKLFWKEEYKILKNGGEI